MSIHSLKQTLIERLPGTDGLIMQYERGGTGREIYTAIVRGQSYPVTVGPGAPDEVIILALINAVEAAKESAT